eukprot:282764-Ditylum_brightwellii.AAC.1
MICSTSSEHDNSCTPSQSIAMASYIKAAPEQFKHPLTPNPEHAPHDYVRPRYKPGPQMAPLKQ